MKYELYESHTDILSLVVFRGNEIIAIYEATERNDVEQVINVLAENEEAYHDLGRNCYTRDTVAEYMAEDGIEKYDEEGNSINLDDHPWTLQELYEEVKSDSCLLERKPGHTF